MAPRETENNAYAKFGVTNKEHYDMLWYFLEWSITRIMNLSPRQPRFLARLPRWQLKKIIFEKRSLELKIDYSTTKATGSTYYKS